MKRRDFLAACVAASAVPAAAFAQSAGPVFRRGINIWHLMETTRRVAENRPVWPAFDLPQNAMPEYQIRQLRRIGFDFVRLPVLPEGLMTATADELPHVMEKIRGNVARFLDAGFNVIVDLHPGSQMKGDTPSDFAAGPDNNAFRHYEVALTNLAKALVDFPRDRIALELMNEPWLATTAELARWQTMVQRLHDAARGAAGNLSVVLGGGERCGGGVS